MARKPKTPDILLPRAERIMRAIARAVVAAHPSVDQTVEPRVSKAVDALLGLPRKKGAPRSNRDDLLELLAFQYSVETRWNGRKDVSLRSLAEELVAAHPGSASNSEPESVVRDLLRTFNENRARLLAEHSFDGSDDFIEFYRPVRTILLALESAGVPVEWSALPPGAKVNWVEVLSDR